MSEINKLVRPQDDFFTFVNGKWLKDNPIPPSESKWGTFYALNDKVLKEVKIIVDELCRKDDDLLTYDQILLKTFFMVGKKYSDFFKENLKTLNEQLEQIANLTNKNQLANFVGKAHRKNISLFWANIIDADDKNSQIQVLRICQDGLTLPNRDYYLEQNDRMKNIRKKYEEYFYNSNNYIDDQSKAQWNLIFDFEQQIAKASWTDIKLRDVEKNYSKFTVNQLQSRFPSFDWMSYFGSLGWKSPNDNIVINQPSFIDEVLNLIEKNPLEVIKKYLSWRVIDCYANFIDKNLSKIKFDFHGKMINGQPEQKPIWKQVISQANCLVISEALGREYATKHFPESSKNAVIKITEDIKLAYHKRIDKLTWMSDATKIRAHKKLDNTKLLIGYPSTWRDFSNLKFLNNNHLQNIISACEFWTDIQLSKIGNKPIPDEWKDVSAHTVNAYYDPNELAICFPAAILQTPYFDPQASYACNLGGIGAVVGHELTHGFDDQGCLFDENGNMSQWQTKAEIKSFTQKSKTIIDQADKFEVVPGVNLLGKLVAGEAIADIGGIELAIEALCKKDNDSIVDLFTTYVKTECDAERDEFAIQMAKTDPHPPSKFRVNCSLSNIDWFYKVYDLKPGDKLYLPPEKRCQIW